MLSLSQQFFEIIYIRGTLIYNRGNIFSIEDNVLSNDEVRSSHPATVGNAHDDVESNL